MIKLEDIHHSIAIRASRERVWECLTTPGLVEQWLGCIGFKPEPGHLFYMQPDAAKREAGVVEGATHCEVEALEKPDRMRFSWFMPGTPKTHVALAVSDNGDGTTIVRLVHDGWDQFDPEQIRGIRDMLDGGWSSYVLPALRGVAEAEA